MCEIVMYFDNFADMLLGNDGISIGSFQTKSTQTILGFGQQVYRELGGHPVKLGTF